LRRVGTTTRLAYGVRIEQGADGLLRVGVRHAGALLGGGVLLLERAGDAHRAALHTIGDDVVRRVLGTP